MSFEMQMLKHLSLDWNGLMTQKPALVVSSMEKCA